MGTSGLAAYWRLDEATGTQACDSKGTSHGTYAGGVIQGQAGATLSGNSSASFNGSSGRVEIPSTASIAPTAGLTVEAWAYTGSASGTLMQTVVGKDGSYLLQFSGNNVYWRVWTASGDGWYSLTASAVVKAQEWQHVAGTYDGRVMRVYVDGEEMASRVLPGSSLALPSTAPLRLGQGLDWEGPAWMLGRLDDVAVYSRALTQFALLGHADAATPETQIAVGPDAYANGTSGTFSFSSPDSPSGYECAIDSGAWATCASPKTYEGLSDAEHEFAVRAVSAAGVKDVTPAKRKWRVDPLGLYPIQTIHGNGADLQWAAADASAAFTGYEVHRGASEGFMPSASTRLASIGDRFQTTFRDTTARAGATFTYKLVVNGAVAGTSRTVTLPAEGQAVSSLQPRPEDARAAPLWEEDGCRNFGAWEWATVGPSGGVPSRMLVGFDLRHIPAEATVSSATLSLSAYASPDVPLTVEAHRMTAAWEEGDASRPRCGKGASWVDAAPGVTWQTPGGDHDTSVVDAVTRSRGAGGWDDFNVTSLVRGWVRGDYPNHGVLFKLANEGTATNWVDYRTDDYPWNKESRPKLVVSYADGAAVIKPSVGVTSPSPGQQLSGSVMVTADAGDDRRVEQVEFLVDGAVIGTDPSAPYSASWNTNSATRGSHSLTARATDDAGNVTTSSAVGVTVDNSSPPTVSITEPLATYPLTVKADSPAAYWRLGETSGTTAADASGNSRTGTYGGTYTLNRPSLLLGDADPALALTKAANVGRMSSSALTGLLGTKVTAEAWVDYSTIPSGTADNYVLSRGWGAIGGWKLIVTRTGSGLQQAGFGLQTGASQEVYAMETVTPGRLHLVGTYDGTTLRAYVNGTQIASEPASLASINSTGAVMAGNALNTSIVADEAAVYPVALTAAQVARHYAAGAGVKGSRVISASASDDLGVDRVEFMLDGNLIDTDTSAPYSTTLNTLSATAPVADGKHVLTARAVDSSGNGTISAPQDLWVANAGDSKYATSLSSTAPPTGMTWDPAAGATQDKAGFDVAITSLGRQPVLASETTLRYRWIGPDGAVVATGPGNALGGDVAAGGTRTVTGVLVDPPALPDGVDRGEYVLRFDLYDTAQSKWYSDQGAKPLEHRVVVNRSGAVGLGLERFYQYDGESLGAGMTQHVNLASGNSIVRWSPWEAPGRGVSTLLDLSYNSLEDHSRSPAGNNMSLSISSLTRFGSQLEIHPHKADQIAGSTKRYAEIADGDGTVHRFTGQQASDSSIYWVEPTGVHLYMRRYSTTDPKRAWAISRPDRTTFFFDEDGFPTYVEDGNHRGLTFTLEDTPAGEDPGGPKKRITQVTDDGGRSFTITYFGKADCKPWRVRGKIKRITDHTGSQLDFVYYHDGNLLRLIQRGGPDPDGTQLPDRSLQFVYTDWSTSNPAPSNVNDPDPRTSGQSTRLYSVRDPRGNSTVFSYLPASSGADRFKLASRTDREGKQTTFAYDRVARRTTVTAPLSRVTKYDYDTDGKVVKIIDPLNRNTLVEWQDRHVTKVTEPSDSATPITTQYAYDRNGYLTQQTDQLGRTTKLTYEYPAALDGDTSIHWASGRTTGHVSQLDTVTDPKGVLTATPTNDYQWSFDYDSRGNVVTSTDPLARVTTNTYDGTTGDLTSTTDARGNETDFSNYDPNGLATTINDAGDTPSANDRITKLGYTADGLLEWVQDPIHASQSGGDPTTYRRYLRYDAFHRLARQSTPRLTDGAATRLLFSDGSYDANDNLTTEYGLHESPVKTVGHRTVTEYDRMDRPTKVTGPLAGDGRLSAEAAADYKLHVSTVAYDAAGRVVQETSPRGNETTGVANDSAVLYDYDDLDRVIRAKRYDDSGTALIEHACYDTAGNLASVTVPRAQLATVNCAATGSLSYTTRFQYFDDHQLKQQTDPENHTSSVLYDGNGDPEKTTDARGKQTVVEYDQLRRVVREREPVDGSPATTQYEYDEVGNAIRVASPRAWDTNPGLSSYAGKQYVTTTTYNEFDEPVTTQLGNLSDYVHRGFDVNGRLTYASQPVANASMPMTGGSPDRKQASTYTYFDTGWIRTSRNPGLNSVRYDYSPEGWQTARFPARPGCADGSDPASDACQVEQDDIDHRTEWSYYPDGALREKSARDKQKAYFVYDANGNMRSSVQQPGNTSNSAGLFETLADYDTLDRLTKVRDRRTPQSAIGGPALPWKLSRYSYDADGNVVQQFENGAEDPGGTMTDPGRRGTFTYDQAGWLRTFYDYGTSSGSVDDRITGYDYEATGWPKLRRVAKPTASATDPFAAGNPQVLRTDYTYLDNGLVTRLTNRDDNGAIVEDHTLEYRDGGIFVNGNQVKDTFTQKRAGGGGPCETAAAGCYTGYQYDSRDRLTSEVRKRATTSTNAYQLNPNGSIDTFTRPIDGQTVTDRYHYDSGQITSVDQKVGLGQYDVAANYFYNFTGDLTCVTAKNYGRDTCKQFDSSASVAGLLEHNTYDALDRLTAHDTYRANGENDDASNYEYDALDRPVKQTEKHGPNGQAAGSRVTKFDYYGLSSNVSSEQRDPVTGAPGNRRTKSYAYDADGTRIGLTDTTHNPDNSVKATREFAYGHDAHGSISMLLGPAGKVQASYGYTAYGDNDNQHPDSQPGADSLTRELDPSATGTVDQGADDTLNPYRYSDKRADTGSGTLDMGARRFSPSIGGYLQDDFYEDALGDLGLTQDALTNNRYALAGGNPVSYMELDGHRPALAAGGGGGGRKGRKVSQASRKTMAPDTVDEIERSTIQHIDDDNAAQASVRTARRKVHKDLKVPDPGESVIDRAFGRDYVSPEKAGGTIIENGPGSAVADFLKLGKAKAGPPRTRLVPGPGLKAHESADLGHTLARHVGLSNRALRARLGSVGTASTFANRALAEEAISGALTAN